jgi:hypothetical protein
VFTPHVGVGVSVKNLGLVARDPAVAKGTPIAPDINDASRRYLELTVDPLVRHRRLRPAREQTQGGLARADTDAIG